MTITKTIFLTWNLDKFYRVAHLLALVVDVMEANLGIGAYGMGATLGGGMGIYTGICITGVARVLRGGAGIRWGWCATL